MSTCALSNQSNPTPAPRSPSGGRARLDRTPRSARLLLAGAFLILAGCASDPNFKPQQVVQEAETALADARTRLETLPPDDLGRIEAEKAVAVLEGKLADLKTRMKVQEDAGQHPDDAAAIATIQTVGSIFGPIGSAVSGVASVLLVPVLGGWIRERNKRKAVETSASEVLKAVQTVATSNGGILDFNDDDHRTQLKAEMNDAGMNLVAKVGATVPRTKRRTTKAKATTKRRTAKKAVKQ